jgi:signal transduction histidine kinase
MKRAENSKRSLSMYTHPGAADFRLRQITVAVLNLFVLAALLLLHTLFSALLGEPSPWLLVALGFAFLVMLLEIFWLLARSTFSETMIATLSWASVVFNLCLAVLFTLLTNREDSPYFVLLAIPVLQAAYQFALPALVGVIAISDSMMLFWVWHYSTYHPPVLASEYLEAGTIALIYSLVGLLVWSLVNQLRWNQGQLEQKIYDLERTRVQLAEEEKLAAVGRLSSAIAHEIRNPVAMITSSMATAESEAATPEARKEMYSIAAAEAERLERLTRDFLSYARPSAPQRTEVSISELLGYIAEVANAYAQRKGVTIAADFDGALRATVDSAQFQRALLNLVMNAIDAADANTVLRLRAERMAVGELRIEVENSGAPIPDDVLAKIFEPFYTTKTHGTGLGLAIARNIARAHGGDVCVWRNQPGRVCFAITFKEDAGAVLEG